MKKQIILLFALTATSNPCYQVPEKPCNNLKLEKMKRMLKPLMVAGLLLFAVGAWAEDLKGRVYKSYDEAQLKELFMYMMENDPEGKPKEAKTPEQIKKEKEAVEMFCSMFKLSMEASFKSKNRFSFKVKPEMVKEIKVQGQDVMRKLTWAERATMNLSVKPALALMAHAMSMSGSYNPNSRVLFHEDDFEMVLLPGGEAIEVHVEGFKIPMKLVK